MNKFILNCLCAVCFLPSVSAQILYQLDFQGDYGGAQLQSGWNALFVPPQDKNYKEIMARNLTIEAGGEGGYFIGRSGGREFNKLDKELLPTAHLHGDLAAAVEGDGTVKFTFENLEQSTIYTLTVWHNSASDANPSFSSDNQIITPEVLVGKKLLARKGSATNFNSGINPKNSNVATEDTDLKPTIVRFKVTTGSTAVVVLKSSDIELPMSGMQLKRKRKL